MSSEKLDTRDAVLNWASMVGIGQETRGQGEVAAYLADCVRLRQDVDEICAGHHDTVKLSPLLLRLRDAMGVRGCACQLEAGDSTCPVHGMECE